jgi:hypothetical protein
VPSKRNLVEIRRSPGGVAGPIGGGHGTNIRNEQQLGDSSAGDFIGLKDLGADVKNVTPSDGFPVTKGLFSPTHKLGSHAKDHPRAIRMHLFLFGFGKYG